MLPDNGGGPVIESVLMNGNSINWGTDGGSGLFWDCGSGPEEIHGSRSSGAGK